MDGHSGLALPIPELPRTRDPLWLQTPYTEGGQLQDAAALSFFDQMRTFPKKFKPKPETPDEVRECKQHLAPKDLLLVTGGPKTIDFGTISVFTEAVRNFSVMNELRSACLVAIEVGAEDELQGTTPPSQVIPPGASAGFDIVFKCDDPTSYRRTVKYVINGVHVFKFTVTAEVVPIDLNTSTEDMTFRFPDGSVEQTMALPLTLTNSGTCAPSGI